MRPEGGSAIKVKSEKEVLEQGWAALPRVDLTSLWFPRSGCCKSDDVLIKLS